MRRLILAVLVILTLGVAANAQTFRGSINGTVTDPSGGSVPNATVKATESSTGIDHTTVTSSDGTFALQDLALGAYKVVVTAQGFPTYSVDKVQVTAGQIYTLNVKLTLQSTTTTVEVSAAALTLDTTTQTQTMTLSEDMVQDIPLNGRDFTQMISVSPGFGGYNVGGFGSLNGTRPNQINWQIDGVDNNDFWHNIPAVNQGGVSGIAGVILPIDSVTEFSAQTSSGPEGGRNAGGTVNVVTKSGGNTIHGSLYYYNRNEFYGASSPFFVPSATVPKAPRLRNENYGFSLGGPIIKNKTFYFLSYEKQDFIIGLSGVATEPSDAWIAQASAVLTRYGKAQSAASTNAIGPNGFWPRSGSGSIAGLPATLNNFFSPIAETGYSYNGVARIDQEITNKHHLYIRWFGGQGNQIAPLGGSPALGTASSNLKYYFEVAPIHVFNYSAVLNSTLTNKITNQLLFGANYFNQIFHDFNNAFDTKAMGLFLSPDAVNKQKYILGAPNIKITGFEQTGLTPPEGRNDLTWHITDVVSHSIGAHQLRYGAEVRQAHLNEFYHRRGTGKFVFDGTQGPWANDATVDPTTKALADFLAGDVSSATIAVGDPERIVVVNAFNLYFQDSWQITKKLNLNYGLRYEYFGPMHSDKKDIANFIPGQGFRIQGAGLDSLFPADKNNFAPRIGFAYQPTGSSDLVVRGGFGVFYDQINLNPFLDFRPPISAPQGIEGNPFGSKPVSTYGAPLCGTLVGGNGTGFQWDAVQQATCPAGYTNAGAANPASSIFAGVQSCSDPNCAAAGDPKGLSAYSVSQTFRTPYFYNYNLQVEKGFGSAGVFQIGYVGSQGRKLNLVGNINQAGAFPNFGNILQLNTIGTSNYNALQAIYRLRTWHGLSSQFAYTWSHALDDISEYRATILDDAFNRKLDYGNGDFDTRHLFTVSATYDIPRAGWASGAWSSRLVNGWQLSSVMNFHTGQPYDEVRPYLNLLSDPFKGTDHKFSAANGGTIWVNPAAFCDPNAGDPGCTGSTFGNLARNKYYGPGFGSVDFSVIKNVPITERVKVQLRADMFNLFNRINLASGVGSVSVGGNNSPNYNTCAESLTLHHCTSAQGFGLVFDTIGDFNGAPGLGPGEAFNLQLVAKIIF